ncbi:hypothetical protein [Ascidiaceihabitans sp.]|uniref:hypothetical protein n=1 Tax=Ascidiaceihabitans sp. TaxID=1872644 RepID=UPI00329872BA
MKDKRTTITYFVIFLAAVGFPLAWLGHTEYCAFVDGKEVCGISFFDRFLSSPPNEIGDTLAGVFGSLAFLAAAVAVVMQSFELAAQREELRLTRIEFEAQREATQEMAIAMKAQAEVFKDEMNSRAEYSAERLLDQYITGIINHTASEKSWGSVWEHDGGHEIFSSPSSQSIFATRNPWERNLTLDDTILQAAYSVYSFHKLVSEWLEAKIEFNKGERKTGYSKLLRYLNEIIALESKLSADQKQRLKNIDIEHFRDFLAALLEMEIWELESETP